MKWLAVILALLNLATWMLGMKEYSGAAQYVSASQFETINAAAMSVIEPPEKGSVLEGVALEEENLAQLKLDKRGQVLMKPGSSIESHIAQKKSGQLMRVIVPDDRSNLSVAAKPEPEPEPEPEPVAVAKVEVPSSKVGLEKIEKTALSCYRVGPFINHNSLASVRRKLESRGTRYRVEEDSNAKNIKAVRVYLAASGPEALDAARKRLKQMNVEHFVIKVNGVQLIQLGYFSEPARATKFQRTLKGRGIDALTETIYRKTNINSWLDVQLASNELMVSLKLRAPVRAKKQTCQ